MKTYRAYLIASILAGHALAVDPSIAKRNSDAETRWASFENPQAQKGRGGIENAKAKGHAFDGLRAGETKVLFNLKGPGEIRRIWLTLDERNPKMLRSLRLDMYWDDARSPAVSVPLGDFFGAIQGHPTTFENELFSNPEGRSFNCYIPMPFRKAARVTITNESDRPIARLFYDVDALQMSKADASLLYFHASWHRERHTVLGKDFELLPRVAGEGKFIGAHVGVTVDPANSGWWGEGEVKMFLDGDAEYPTIAGTGAEDYIGTGWGEGVFHGRFQGSLLADAKTGNYGFYRYHVPDPVYFHKDARVTIQQIGGDTKANVSEMLRKSVGIKPVTIDDADHGRFVRLLDSHPETSIATDQSPQKAWVNFYRSDDWSAVALFYLDRPENGLPPLVSVKERTEGLPDH